MMIDRDLVIAHLKADDDLAEQELIDQYIASAVTICEGYCNRKIYETKEVMAADFDAALLDIITVTDAFETAMADPELSEAAGQLYLNRYLEQMAAIRQRTGGIVVNDSIRAAILIVTGDLYTKREDVTVDQIPVGAMRLLQPYARIAQVTP